MDKKVASLIRLLYAGAVVALLFAGYFALVMATFATDAPSSSQSLALLIGAAVFLVFALPSVGLPLWAARRARRLGGAGLLPAIIFAVLCLAVFPFGTILGVLILLKAREIRRIP